MSEVFSEGQESKTVPSCHDRPPQYDSGQPSQDLLTSLIENEHARRTLTQQGIHITDKFDNWADEIDKKPTHTDCLFVAELFLEIGQLFTELGHISTETANLYKERAVQNTKLYTTMGRLTDSEFDQMYASLKRDPSRQMRHKLAQDRCDCYDRDCGSNSQRYSGSKQIDGTGDSTFDSPCSHDQFFELLAKVDKINDKLGQNLQSHDTVNVSKTTDDAAAKPHWNFWKRIMRRSARP
ncbi:uncharacterized protein N7482_006561 [Penicillium canariense]|uniref:Uncharacterized protein n=1 Tax=Penicillium canariense TaxID=189055 RepID=A0A9W9LIA3_9EURO|nr:uncharacterized protein N7482_006561 [Penicillium canariense]KAJ5159557.1 hypothetical protein N7482_006561 [Penicillium canariense]